MPWIVTRLRRRVHPVLEPWRYCMKQEGKARTVGHLHHRLSRDSEIIRPTGEAFAGSNGITLSPGKVKPVGIATRGGCASAILVMLNATVNFRIGNGKASPVL